MGVLTCKLTANNETEYYSDDGKTIDDFSIIKNNANFNDFDSENNIHEASYNQYLKIKS